MANDIYLRTHDGLAAMVPARVATRVLVGALKAKGVSANRISGAEMEEILLGPVFKELEPTLPRDGLRRNLRLLAASVRGEADGERPSSAVATDSPPVGRSGRNGKAAAASKAQLASALILDKDADEPGTSGGSDAPITPLLRQIEAELEGLERDQANGESEVAQPPAAAKPQAPTRRPTRAPLRNFSDKGLEQAVLHFASIDHITLVAALRQDGSVAGSRGSGVDLEALARYGLMGLKLLQRRGELRSYYLGHSLGQLFLLPVGTDVIIVVGTSELNIGAVFAALAALKEEV